MKSILSVCLIVVLGFLVAYGLISFVEWKFPLDFSQWGPHDRWNFVGMWSIACLPIILILIITSTK